MLECCYYCTKLQISFSLSYICASPLINTAPCWTSEKAAYISCSVITDLNAPSLASFQHCTTTEKHVWTSRPWSIKKHCHNFPVKSVDPKESCLWALCVCAVVWCFIEEGTFHCTSWIHSRLSFSVALHLCWCTFHQDAINPGDRRKQSRKCRLNDNKMQLYTDRRSHMCQCSCQIIEEFGHIFIFFPL